MKNNNEDPYQDNKVFSQIVKKQGNGITDQDLDDMFKVLKGQKEGIEILNKSVNESTRQLMVMERELDLHKVNFSAHRMGGVSKSLR